MNSSNLMPMDSLPLASFTWIAESSKLVGEASTLFPNRLHMWQRIFKDAIDVGICVRSHYTGKLERFALTRIEWSQGEDREVIAWHFKNIDPEARVQSVTIFND